MPRSTKKQIDEDEKKVIAQLQKNPRESINEIAKKCGFSRQKVWRLINKLEKDKTIWGYNVVIDDNKLDVKRYIMLIKKSPQPLGDTVNKIIDLTMHKKGKEIGVDIICSTYLHGKYDWMFIFSAKDIKSVKKFNEILIREYENVISEVDIMEYIFSIKKCGITNPEVKKLKEYF